MTFSKENKLESKDSKHAGCEFQSFALAAQLLKNVAELGFTEATPVQAQVIPAALAGGDLLVSSQTGSGKTAAFLLPLINQLIEANPNNSPVPGRAQPKVLVLCPTRELAQQVTADAVNLVRGMKGIRIATVMGGMPYGKQIQALKGALLVVATPGRLLDLCDSKAIRLDDVKQLVIDEADRMLDMGFADDLEAIDKRCTGRNQTLMFSATFAPKIMSLANALTKDAKRIELAHAGDKHANIEQKLHWADSNSHKHKLLEHILADASLDQAVVFASTQVESEKIADTLRANGYEATALHGAMPQAVRMRRLESLRKGHTKILVATDVAARGIDVPRISHVINFGLPMKPEDYTHRIGRTGRAGKTGIAFSFVTGRKDFYRLNDIERYTKAKIEKRQIPTLREVNLLKKQRFMELLTSLVKAGGLDKYESIVKELNDAGISSDDLAAALIKYNLPVEKDVQELPEFVEERRERPDREFRGGAPRNNDSRGNTGNSRPYEKKGGYEKGGYEKRREGGGGDRPRKSRFARV